MTPSEDPPRCVALRACRAAAASALRAHPRRAQATWDDLAAWPEWAALGDEACAALSLRVGAWWHAGAWQHCISGPLLRTLQAGLGDDGFARLLSATGEAGAPPEDTATLAQTGMEALLASVDSPLLRVVLREKYAPTTLPLLPALDAARARRAVQEAGSSVAPAHRRVVQ